MRTWPLYLAIMFLDFILPVQLSGQDTCIAICDKSTFISRSDGSTNFCNLSYFDVGNPSGSAEYRGLLHFPVNSGPYYNNLVVAYLWVKIVNAPFDANACRINGLGNWDECSVTWDNTAGGQEDCNPEHWGYTTGGWMRFDVTDLVYQWLSGGYPNQGFILIYPNTVVLRFYSRRAVDSANRPYLEMQFNTTVDCGIVGVSEETTLPERTGLTQNYPNPFNPATKFEYTLNQRGSVKIEVFNELGQQIVTLVDRTMEAGNYQVTWNGKSASGITAPSGTYFYRLSADGVVQTKKMILIK